MNQLPTELQASNQFKVGDVFLEWSVNESFSREERDHIYLGSDLVSGETVILKKCLKKSPLLAQEEYNLQTLAFPHAPRTISLEYDTESRPVLVMSYHFGETLRECVNSFFDEKTEELIAPLTEKRALEIIQQVAEALKNVYDRTGLIHCDIKPSNIILNQEENQNVIILDFGNAADRNNSTGRRSGCTAVYASPEIIDNKVPTVAADIYSLGCILFELISGRPAFIFTGARSLLKAKAWAQSTECSIVKSSEFSEPMAYLIKSMTGFNCVSRIENYDLLMLRISETLAQTIDKEVLVG